jgi:dihydroflavonol-4-reductase
LSLVTGATGFLGSHLARVLAARGDTVRALVRPTSDRRRLAGIDAIEWAEGDVTDALSVERPLAGVARVFHCGAVYEIGASDTAKIHSANVGGAQNVLRAASERRAPAAAPRRWCSSPSAARTARSTSWPSAA